MQSGTCGRVDARQRHHLAVCERGNVAVSGDSSCADHNIAWRTRHTLKLDYVPAGVSGDATRPDNIVYDITNASGVQIGVSASGWGHPACSAAAVNISKQLPTIPQ